MIPQKLILKSHLSPGDIVMLTSAVRDLHCCNPGKFITDVRTSAKSLWEHNPYITPLKEGAQDVEVLECHYPQIHRSNQTPYHFVHGFGMYLSEKLGVPISPVAFKGDIHLSNEEKSWTSQVNELLGFDCPFWIVVAGGKNDYTIKWWHKSRYQEVVDHFKGKVLFVQVGEDGHHHPPLKGVLDLRGKTSMRQIVRLVHHAQGVLSPVTFLMHLAAAVETKPNTSSTRPAVVVAGGREPVHWEAYPHHQFLHTQGALPCCQNGGCWRARTLPLGDGDSKDEPQNCCIDVVGSLPRCMDMITAKKTIEAIETYFIGGTASYLKKNDSKLIEKALSVAPLKEKSRKHDDRKSHPPRRRINHNKNLLRFIGLRRSGIHPIINWLTGHYEGRICFINDVTHQKKIAKDHACDSLPSMNGSFNEAVSLDEKKDTLILGYEDTRLIELRDNPPCEDLFGESKTTKDILLLRDPFNTFASRLYLRRKQPENIFAKELILLDANGESQLAQRWKFYAHEYLGQTQHLKNQKLTINYNRWVSDEKYREQLCDSLDVPFLDNYRDCVPRYGFGSSFDGCSHDQKGTSMKLFKRWEYFREDEEYLAFFSDPEILKLSETIFGDVLDHHPIKSIISKHPLA